MHDGALFRRFCILGVAAWLIVFSLAPNAGLLVVSFLTRHPEDFVAPGLTLDAYTRLMDPTFAAIFWESVRLAALATLVCLLAGYPFAYALARAGRRARPWLLLLVVIPFWTNSLIRTYAVIIILKSRGVLSNLLEALGLTSGPVSLLYTDTAMFIGFTYTLLPFMILPLFAAIEKLDRNLLDAARDLGAGSLRAFWNVTLPLTMPGILAGSMLVFLPALGMFYIPELLGGGKSMLIGNFIKNQMLLARDWPLGAAASTVLTVALAVMIVLWRLAARRAREDEGDDLLAEGAP